MPSRVNLHEAGIRRSKRIKQLIARYTKRHKAHATFGSKIKIKKAIGIFMLLCTVSDYVMPRHRLPPNSTFLQHTINRMDKANEHCDGTLNNVHHFSFVSDVNSNEVFTYKQESRNHWTLVPRACIPRTERKLMLFGALSVNAIQMDV